VWLLNCGGARWLTSSLLADKSNRHCCYRTGGAAANHSRELAQRAAHGLPPRPWFTTPTPFTHAPSIPSHLSPPHRHNSRHGSAGWGFSSLLVCSWPRPLPQERKGTVLAVTPPPHDRPRTSSRRGAPPGLQLTRHLLPPHSRRFCSWVLTMPARPRSYICSRNLASRSTAPPSTRTRTSSSLETFASK
jgi:hypothetical protein